MQVATFIKTGLNLSRPQSKQLKPTFKGSIKNLIFLGFSLVLIPLASALIYSANQVTNLSQQSTLAINKATEFIQHTRQIEQLLLNMERIGSQYRILNDAAMMASYQQQHQLLLATVTELNQSHTDTTLTNAIADFQLNINKLYLAMISATPLPLPQLRSEFIELNNQSQKISNRSNQLIEHAVITIEGNAQSTSNKLFTSLLAIPFTMAIALIFIVLIIKPLKRLIERIHRLEQGDFKDKIYATDKTQLLEIGEISEALERMRMRLHALELQKSSFIRHISHELKTPLAAIREGTELLYDHSVGELNAGQQEITLIIRQSVVKLQTLIESLLDFNIVLDSTSLQDSQPHTMTSLIEQVLADRKLDIMRKNITVDQQIPAIEINCNGKQFQVVIDNILSNAIKFSPVNSAITLRAVETHGQLVVSVSDNGPGISAQAKEYIFDAFYQGIPPDSDEIKGSGLGLTIVQELLMRMGGTIELISPIDNSIGCCFVITLPNASMLEVNHV